MHEISRANLPLTLWVVTRYKMPEKCLSGYKNYGSYQVPFALSVSFSFKYISLNSFKIHNSICFYNMSQFAFGHCWEWHEYFIKHHCGTCRWFLKKQRTSYKNTTLHDIFVLFKAKLQRNSNCPFSLSCFVLA